jgi:hypothetical protein
MKAMHARAGSLMAVLLIVVVVGLWLQPATAHLGTPTHLWNRHLRSEANQLYLQNTRVYVSAVFSLGALVDQTVTRLCPVGWQAIGGGVDFETADADVQVISSAPLAGGSNLFTADQGRNGPSRGWRVTMHNNGALAVDGAVGVICAR